MPAIAENIRNARVVRKAAETADRPAVVATSRLVLVGATLYFLGIWVGNFPTTRELATADGVLMVSGAALGKILK